MRIFSVGWNLPKMTIGMPIGAFSRRYGKGQALFPDGIDLDDLDDAVEHEPLGLRWRMDLLVETDSGTVEVTHGGRHASLQEEVEAAVLEQFGIDLRAGPEPELEEARWERDERAEDEEEEEERTWEEPAPIVPGWIEREERAREGIPPEAWVRVRGKVQALPVVGLDPIRARRDGSTWVRVAVPQRARWRVAVGGDITGAEGFKQRSDGRLWRLDRPVLARWLKVRA